MSEKISRYIVDTLIEGKIITDEQRDVYEYCFNTITEIVLSVISALVIGVLLKKITAVIIFMAVFFPIRSFCGGFHCETSRGCYIMSMIFLIAAITCYPLFYSVKEVTFIAAAVLNYAAVIILAPVGGKYKQLESDDKKRMKITAVIITFLIYTIEIILYVSDNEYFYLIAVTVLLSLISMITGKFVLKKYHSQRFLDHSQEICKKQS